MSSGRCEQQAVWAAGVLDASYYTLAAAGGVLAAGRGVLAAGRSVLAAGRGLEASAAYCRSRRRPCLRRGSAGGRPAPPG